MNVFLTTHLFFCILLLLRILYLDNYVSLPTLLPLVYYIMEVDSTLYKKKLS